MIKLFFTVFAVFLTLAIARESIVWALIIGAFLFVVLCWLNNEPDSNRRKRARNQKIESAARGQNKLINQK